MKTEVLHQYRLTANNSEVDVTYIGGRLQTISVLNDSGSDNLLKVVRIVTIEEAHLAANAELFGIQTKQLTVATAAQKIALWCELYKIQYGVPYKVTTPEAAKVKNIELTQSLILLFFNSNEWWAKEKTISRYSSNYNELRRIEQTGSTVGNSSTKARTNINDLEAALMRRFG